MTIKLAPANPRPCPYIFYILWHADSGYTHTHPMKNAREASECWPDHALVYEGVSACGYTRLIDARAMCELLNECGELPDGFSLADRQEIAV